LERSSLDRGTYYFALSSLAPNKNLKWLVETARQNPEETMVIAGGINTKVFGDASIPEAENVIYVGYVTDAEAKALLEGCKAFLFPTFYEGFGIPPLEALSCGAKAVVSDTAVMHEVYGESVGYLNPQEPAADISTKLSCAPSDSILEKYSWKKSAQTVADLLEEMAGA
jgi:glycosyltransferase involved in cell wall biosynthesis